MSDEVLDFLEHHGVKGMHWGIRNDRKPSGFRLQTSGIFIDKNLHSATKVAAKQTADLVSKRYGFQIKEVKNLKTENPAEYNYGTTAYVKYNPGKDRNGVIFIKPEDIRKDMADTVPNGWMAEGCGNIRGMLTHETAHAMFHSDQVIKSGFLGPKQVGGHSKALDTALKAAMKQAKSDGIHPKNFLSEVSGYARYSGTKQEAEAEMFSQYHWATNPKPFIKVWGETLHKELGIDPTPFKEVVKHG